jgi:hypothetical protein
MFVKRMLRLMGLLCVRKEKNLLKVWAKKTFIATNGWFKRCKTEENIVYKHMYGAE